MLYMRNLIRRCRLWVSNTISKFWSEHNGIKRSISPVILWGEDWHITLVSYARGLKKRIVLPKNFNLMVHIAKYPPMQYGFKSSLKFTPSKAYYFLSLLTSIPAKNKDLIYEDGWVPINMPILRNGIKDIKSYKDYLIRTGVIECDEIYVPNEKSYWYRWTDKYRGTELQIEEVECPYDEKFNLDYKKAEADLEAMPYLSHWFLSNMLAIDNRVLGYALNICNAKKIGVLGFDFNKTTNKKKDPIVQYQSAFYNIDKINHHEYEVHIDDTVHRLHSVITNMHSDYRNFLTYNGEELVNIDIKNSQPYLACAILNPLFWSRDNQLGLTIFNLSDNIIEPFLQQELYQSIFSFFQKHKLSDFTPYINMVKSGKFYEELANISRVKLGKNISRKEAKILMFYIFFSSNQGRHTDPLINELKKLFSKEIYPAVADLFKIIKTKCKSISADKQHNRLACLLQNIESEIILQRCCKRIWDEANGTIPIFTIHDSIATTKPNLAFVKKVMEEELTKAIGVPPTLDVSYWGIANIEYPQYLPL